MPYGEQRFSHSDAARKITLLGVAKVEEERGEVETQLAAAGAKLDQIVFQQKPRYAMSATPYNVFTKSEKTSN